MVAAFAVVALLGSTPGMHLSLDTPSYITVRNLIDETFVIWLQAQSETKFSHTIPIARKGKASLILDKPGKTYIVLRDSRGNDTHLTWYDFHDLISMDPIPELALAYFTSNEQQAYTTTEHVPVTTYQKKLVTRYINGVQVTEEITVPVVTYQEVHKTGTRIVQVTKPSLQISVGGRLVALSSYLDTRTQPPAAVMPDRP
jgi:hypothetical protein